MNIACCAPWGGEMVGDLCGKPAVTAFANGFAGTIVRVPVCSECVSFYEDDPLTRRISLEEYVVAEVLES